MSTIGAQNRVTIIGASIAGITAAFLLGRSGCQVTLIDPQEFPRRKACGEGLSSLGVEYLKAIGLWTAEMDAQAWPFYGYRIQFETGEHTELTSKNSGRPQGYGISRLSLDTAIHKRVAPLQNVSVLPDTVSSIIELAGNWAIGTANGRELISDDLIVACGGGNVLRRLFPQLISNSVKPPRFGLAFWSKGNWTSTSPSHVQIHHEPEGEYIITPLGETDVNMSILISTDRSVGLKKHDIIEKACKILTARGFRIEDRTDPLGSPSIHSAKLLVKSNLCSPYFIGDSVERFDPIGGMGMTHALFSACLASDEVLSRGSSFRYLRKRRYGAAVLRQMTRVSYDLNVYRSKLLRAVTLKSPHLAYQSNELLKQAFPKPVKKSLVSLRKSGPTLGAKQW